MEITFNIDFDRAEVFILIDNSITLSAVKEDYSFRYKNFDRIEDEQVQDTIKKIVRTLFELEGA